MRVLVPVRAQLVVHGSLVRFVTCGTIRVHRQWATPRRALCDSYPQKVLGSCEAGGIPSYLTVGALLVETMGAQLCAIAEVWIEERVLSWSALLVSCELASVP